MRSSHGARAGGGDPAEIRAYMIAPRQRAPMDRPDPLLIPHYEGYGKVATALNVLCELILGKDRFDQALRG